MQRGNSACELTSYRAIPRTGTNPVCRNALPCRTTAAACLPMHSAAFDSSRQCCGGRVMELLARVRSHATPAVLPPIVFPSYHFLWKKKKCKVFPGTSYFGTKVRVIQVLNIIIRFLAKAIRGPEPGAQVLEPLHLTRILGPPPDVYLHSLLSFFVFLYLSVCEASKLRSLPFTHPIYVASRYFQ